MKSTLQKIFFILIILLATLGAVTGCNHPFGLFLDNNVIVSFVLTADLNADYLSGDISGVISDDSVILSVPAGTECSVLVPTFVFLGRELRVGTAVQTSGASAQDFSSPVTYTLVGWNGDEAEYTVTVVFNVSVIPSDPWAKTLTSYPGAGTAEFNDVAVDEEGNVYAVGWQDEQDGSAFGYGDGVVADGQNGDINAVIVKYAADGTTLWARTVETAYGDSCFNAVAVAPDGSVYAAGYQNGGGVYDYGNSQTTTTDGYPGSVLVKYSSEGTTQWARSAYGNEYSSSFSGVTVDDDGSVYAVGYQELTGSYLYETGVSVSGQYSYNAVIAKYNASGSVQWLMSTFTGISSPDLAGECYFLDVAADSGGYVYAGGYQGLSSDATGTNFYYSSGGISCSGVINENNGVLVCYDTSSGTAQWARSIAITDAMGASEYLGIDVYDSVVYTAGSIYFEAGGSSESFDFGNGQTITGLTEDMTISLVAAYNASGTAQWVGYPTTAPKACAFNDVAAADGVVYAGGYQAADGTFIYGSGASATGGAASDNAVLVSYTDGGTAQGAAVVDSGESDASMYKGLCTDVSGNVYAAGPQYGTSTYTYASGVTATGVCDGNNVLAVKFGKP